MRAIVTAAGSLSLQGTTFRVALGWGGLRADKREGDGATPIGLLPLRTVLYRPDRGPVPVAGVPVGAITPEDGWCDDPSRADYNCPVRLPIAGSAESLWRDDPLYDVIGVLGWNDSPPLSGRGSAIFLHIARGDYAPTEGCVALSSADLRQVLAMGLTELVVVR